MFSTDCIGKYQLNATRNGKRVLTLHGTNLQELLAVVAVLNCGITITNGVGGLYFPPYCTGPAKRQIIENGFTL